MIKLKTFDAALKVKEISEKGVFTGYASVFDNMDRHGDVIRRGAFTKTVDDWRKRDAMPPLLWQHDSRQPIGTHVDMYEDEKGLYVEGMLLVNDVALAREAHALLKAKVISGMSIGFDLPEGGMEFDGKANVWNIKAVNLWENSLATFPANVEARVQEVKTAFAALAPSEFEDLLRDVAGLSRSKAKQVTGLAFSKLLLRDAGEEALREVEKDIDYDFSPILSYLTRA